MRKELGLVSREFETWRMQREKRTHTPNALIAKAVSLRDSYSDAHIVKALKINSTTFKQWIKREGATPTQDFVELPPLAVEAEEQISIAHNTGERSSLQIGLPSGTTLTLSGNASALANFVVQLASKGAV